MTHAFQRYTAAGNTFVVLNTWEDPLSLSREEMKMLVQKACDRKEGIGADGMILVNQPSIKFSSPSSGERPGEGPTFRMDFYNPDGTTGMLCGNGTRCAVRAAQHFGFATSDTVDFEVLGAINRAEIKPDGNIKVYFQDPITIRLNFDLPLEGNTVKTGYVDLGSQHAVIVMPDVESLDVAHVGPLVRWHSEFVPVGANANFIEVRDDGDEKYLRIRTFERGVEGETLACGTGCMSSAIVAKLTGRVPKTPVRLLTQSGEFVTVDFTTHGEHVSSLSLEGSAIAGEQGMFIFDETAGTLDVQYI